MILTSTRRKDRKTVSYLISNHPECENIALLRGDSAFKTERGGVQQLWCQVLEVIVVAKFALYNVESKGEPIVNKARMTIPVDEDVLLCDIFTGERINSWLHVLTGLRRLWTIRIEWRYCNPREVSASFESVLGSEHCAKDRGLTY